MGFFEVVELVVDHADALGVGGVEDDVCAHRGEDFFLGTRDPGERRGVGT
ncbi:hypothetical protein Cst04h_12370 [Corynebacterium striatum]|uniref:Uncharacterized protein n=1 Tax=Corynebacterium striatum TaxID=43770 RepID=A0ABC9ZLP4_CORST|nr:hypothetical protein Cst04h_12370 [Corynebacterium striatum]